MKNAEKKDILTRAVSTGVLTNSVFLFCVSLNFCIFAEKEKTQKNKHPCVKNWSKLVLNTGPSMLRNIIGPAFNTRIGSFFFLFCFWKILFFLQGERDFRKQKTKKTKNLDQFLTLDKAKIGPVFSSTANISLSLSISLSVSLSLFLRPVSLPLWERERAPERIGPGGRCTTENVQRFSWALKMEPLRQFCSDSSFKKVLCWSDGSAYCDQRPGSTLPSLTLIWMHVCICACTYT